ncbi:hypothetical protein PENTCL1PPCAC_24186, partial [Pristionchus entomophagus]
LGAEQPSGSTAESARVDASSSATTRQHDNHSEPVIGSDPNTTAVSATAALLNAAHLYPAYTPATPIGHDPNTTMAQHYYAQNPVSFANVGMPFVPVYGLNMFPAPNAATFLPACGGRFAPIWCQTLSPTYRQAALLRSASTTSTRARCRTRSQPISTRPRPSILGDSLVLADDGGRPSSDAVDVERIRHAGDAVAVSTRLWGGGRTEEGVKMMMGDDVIYPGCPPKKEETDCEYRDLADMVYSGMP